MLKNDVIKLLQAIPGNPETCVCDWRKNLSESSMDPTSAGIYPGLEIELVDKNEIPKGSEQWISIGFENSDYNDEGRYINNLEDELDISAQ